MNHSLTDPLTGVLSLSVSVSVKLLGDAIASKKSFFDPLSLTLYLNI